MSRIPRIEYNGATYHVIQRGNNREFVFMDDDDKGYLINLIKEVKDSMGFKVYGYVLMNNHYHFVIKTLDLPLHKIMHQVNNKYSKYFNYKFGRIGHVFQGRYKSILVQDESYLLSLIRYIHQNPVRAGVCSVANEYKWSSDIFYRTNMKSFVDIDTVLDIISKNKVEAVKRYREYIKDEEEADYDNVKAIGDEGFQLLYSKKDTDKKQKSLDKILLETGISISDYELIKKGSKKRHLTRYKLSYAKSALEQGYTLKEISKNINISSPSLHDMIGRYLQIS